MLKVNKDHLDNKISISGSLATNGENPLDIKGGVKVQSRFLSSIDRLGGCIPDIVSAFLEGKSRIIRAKNDAKVALIEAIGKKNVAKLENNDHFAFKAINNSIDKSFARQEKIDLVCAEALTDLTDNPPTEDETDCDQDKLSEAFLNRLGNHVENATEEEIRAKWAKVLASEIKKPNTFSAKTMRIVDELRPEVAALFEEFCNFRLDKVILVHFVEHFNYSAIADLTTAGLILDPNIGLQLTFGKAVAKNGNMPWFLCFNEFAISIPEDSNIDSLARKENPPLIEMGHNDDKIAVRTNVLTDEGMAIASILKDNQLRTLHLFANSVSFRLKDTEIIEYMKIGEDYVPFLRSINGTCMDIES